MTIETMIKDRERLISMVEEYYNMLDTGAASLSDYSVIYDLKTEIKALTDTINKTIEPFTDTMYNAHIAGYRYFNGVRIVNVYIRSFYKGRPLLTYDYSRARRYVTKQAAAAARSKLMQSGRAVKYE